MLIQTALRQPYRRETWTTLVRDLFPEGTVTLLAAPAEIDAPHEQVTATRQLGHLQLTDGRVALIEVAAADSVQLSRNRIALRNFVGKLIVPGSSDAVLAVFHQPGRDDWRLTYASRRTTLDPETFAVTHSETSPRRFTFLLGPGETCRTAAGRLKELEGKDNLTLAELERAFSVERLNKDFFKRYKEFYERFTTHLLSSDLAAATRQAFCIEPTADPKEQDKADKPVRDFSKKLLGRLVFLHFLQKKRWLGCPPLKERGRPAHSSPDWSDGDPDFIANFFSQAKAANEADRFHSAYLAPLFFEALNTPDRKGDLFPLTGTRLPYLNGGLFEEDAPALRALDFPPLLFEELLGFFGEYHFTIDENDPEDHEVGIDPEMLGHIFENLLEDNKDKGAFYTPKAIVQYMARESLRHYLETHLGPDPEIALLLAEKDLTRLAKNGFVRQHAKKIAKLLEEVKICDPAIGSGAFPIGLLQEILWTRLTLNWELNTPEDRARLKREIIKNSIHGVDLDPGAVEIARLRFWLALVVDEEIPRPLPNLDYKIHRADSLVEYIRGEPAHLGDVNTAGGMMKAAVEDLIAAKKALFDAHRLPEKRAARFALYRALASLAQLEFTRMRNDEGLFGTDPVRTAQLDRGVKEFGQRIREIDAVKKEKAAMQDTCLARLQDWFDDPERPTFLWHLHFGEVFAKGGFDIVIANPPYYDVKGMDPTLKKEIFRRFATSENRINLFSTFIDLGFGTLMSESGNLAFVIPNSLLHNESYSKIRTKICGKVSQIIKLPDDIFPEATVETILLFTSSTPVGVAQVRSFGSAERFDLLKLNLANLDKTMWTRDPKCRFTLNSSSAEHSILEKMRKGSQPLSFVYETCLGITPYDKSKGHSENDIEARIFHSKSKSSSDHVPLIDGGSIHNHWIDSKPIEWLKYGKWLGRPRERRFFEDPRVVVRQILAKDHPRIVAAFANEPLYHTHVAFTIVGKNCQTDLHARFLDALLCSRAINFFHERSFIDSEKVTFPKALIAHISQLPIPPAPPEDQARLATLAERAAAFAKSGDKDSLRATEREIDGIVYQLFHLTPAEIALIEEALAPPNPTR
ncbi:MAG: N-6 DNA methylase [Verrucomicrobia bacterium]|nr:N-6 DNA methylase [Verrucomicrobiota bacterium]